MTVIRQVEFMRSRVFVTELPGMTRRREQTLIRNCQALARNARAAGVPLSEAWRPVGQFIERASAFLRTEHERETFVAVMQRLRDELFHEFATGVRPGA
ncbi:MAG: hypothetical protein ACP5XB_21045 [Isosphaeraceae bacterium]